jgi:hypothetical protein
MADNLTTFMCPLSTNLGYKSVMGLLYLALHRNINER